jgi:hypothetical protein
MSYVFLCKVIEVRHVPCFISDLNSSRDLLLAFLSITTKGGHEIHPWQQCQKCLQMLSASAQIYRCSISPDGIQGIIIYIFFSKGRQW